MWELDLTETVRGHWQQANAKGRSRLLLVVSAENCGGCDELARQLSSPEVLQVLGADAIVCLAKAGDLYDDPAGRVRVGHWTLESPGFPTTWVFEPDGENGLLFQSLILGPLPSSVPHLALSEALAGTSVWPAEADRVQVKVCAGPMCFVLRESNGFKADLRLQLPA
jgi:hypothetical protein